jgi:uncharacterized membrane protein YbhN (UPF0104 family)
LNSLFSSRFLSKQYIKSLFYNRWIQLLSSLISVGFCLLFIFENFQRLRDTIQSTKINFGLVLCAGFISFLTVLLGALGWWLILQGLGAKIYFKPAANIHLLSSISKYIPGYAWQYISQWILSSKQGISSYTTGIAITLEFVQILWTGTCISFISFPQFYLDLLNINTSAGLMVRIIGIILLPLPPILIGFRPRWFLRKNFEFEQIKIRWLVGSSIVVCLGWFLLGGSLQLFLESLDTASGVSLLYLTFTFSTSLLIGILVIPVPNGLGIREGIMVFLLSKVIPTPIAILAAIFSRLAITFSELIWVMIIVLLSSNPKE